MVMESGSEKYLQTMDWAVPILNLDGTYLVDLKTKWSLLVIQSALQQLWCNQRDILHLVPILWCQTWGWHHHLYPEPIDERKVVGVNFQVEDLAYVCCLLSVLVDKIIICYMFYYIQQIITYYVSNVFH